MKLHEINEIKKVTSICLFNSSKTIGTSNPSPISSEGVEVFLKNKGVVWKDLTGTECLKKACYKLLCSISLVTHAMLHKALF